MPKDVQFPVKLALGITEDMEAAIDAWRRQQPDLPSRSEAIRRLVEKALKDGQES